VLLPAGFALHQQLDRMGLVSDGTWPCFVAFLICVLPGCVLLEFAQNGRIIGLPVGIAVLAGIIWITTSNVVRLPEDPLVNTAVVAVSTVLASYIGERSSRLLKKRPD
jgi:hypothetical protein